MKAKNLNVRSNCKKGFQPIDQSVDALVGFLTSKQIAEKTLNKAVNCNLCDKLKGNYNAVIFSMKTDKKDVKEIKERFKDNSLAIDFKF